MRCPCCGQQLSDDQQDPSMLGEPVRSLGQLELDDMVLFGSRVEPLRVDSFSDRPNIDSPYEMSYLVRLTGPRGGSMKLMQVKSTGRIRTNTAYTVENLRRIEHENQSMMDGWKNE